MFKAFFFIVTSFLFFNLSLAQSRSFQNEIKFASHLIDNYEYKDASLVLKNISKNNTLNSAQFDSVNYFIGWIFYNQKTLDSSSFYLNMVSSHSSYFYKSKFYEAFNSAYLGKYSNAILLLDSIKTDSFTDYEKLKNFEKAAFSLLQHDYKSFEKLSNQFTGSYFPIANEEKALTNYYTKIKEHNPKSPLLAGVMSAIVPGSGKFYTGHRGQGATALVTVVSLAAIAAESYYRAGPKSIQFISFGAIFSIFYAGNIWGSVNSVKKRNDTFYKELERNVLLDMHIPLRRVFN
jgi:hypothetical protein